MVFCGEIANFDLFYLSGNCIAHQIVIGEKRKLDYWNVRHITDIFLVRSGKVQQGSKGWIDSLTTRLFLHQCFLPRSGSPQRL